jgi:hypothetical protein
MEDLNELENSFFLDMTIRKSSQEKTDEYGNYIFEVEASNENLDLQGQIVLQRALLGSSGHFLKNGVISLDHLHKRKGPNGEAISDPTMVIGEPIDVRVDGKKTIVVGKLYKNNDIAKDIINKLKDGSSRIKASVGGIFPKIVKDAKSGTEKIISVLWNDLALTCSPVNSTVSAACFAKSYSPDEFVKALTAGGGTEHAEFTDGRAIIPEDVQTYTHNVTETNAGYEELKDKIRALLAAIKTGEIKGRENAIKFLVSQGLDTEQARAAVREISFQGGQV